MTRLINTVLQLQELCDARAEQAALFPEKEFAELDEAIEGLLGELPPPDAALYRRTMKRNLHAAVPEDQGACSACGASLTPNVKRRLQEKDRLLQCETCGRILYSTEGQPRHLTKRVAVTRAPTHGLIRFSAEELMVPTLKANTREEAILELTRLLEEKGYVQAGDVLAEQVQRRETITSTAVGNALAFPHARTNESGILTFALGLKKKGLDFDSADGKKTKIIFLLVIPVSASAFYLRLLSGFVQGFATADARKQLLACKDSESMWETLLKLTPRTI